jgi:hypothetical protein
MAGQNEKRRASSDGRPAEGWRSDVWNGNAERQAGLPAEARNSEVGERVGGSNSVVESQPSKLLVAGSIPVSRSRLRIEDCGLWIDGGWDDRGLDRATVGRRSIHNPESSIRIEKADVAQLAERVLGKDEVTSSILVIGSRALIHANDEDR